MKRNKLVLATGILFSSVLLASCATVPETAPAEAASESSAPTQVAENNDELICQTVEKTGSHLRQQKTCRTKQQVEDAEREAREFVRDAGRSSARPGGN